MKKLLILFVLFASSAQAQPEVDALRLYLGTTGSSCAVHSGTGAPASGLGAVCDFYFQKDTPYTIYSKTGASTWVEVIRVPGSTSLTTTGALATGSIVSGFGAIDVGADNITGANLIGTTSVQTPSITTGANLSIAPTGDVVFNPTGNDILPQTGYDLNIGALTNKYLTLHAAELWVETLVAQETIATIGGRVLVGPTTTLTADLNLISTTIQVKHNQMASGDRILLQANGAIEWMAVTSGPSGSAGAYTYSVTRNLDGTGANTWTSGDAVFNTGTTNDGFIDLYSISAVTPPKFQFIYNFNATGSVYSSNYAEALQFEFMGDGAGNGINDAVYWGSPSTFLTVASEGMTACSVGTSTFVWEYWNGSAWTSFSPSGTACSVGHNSLTWTTLSGWATTTVNGDSAYWMRLRLTNTPGTPWTTSIVKNSARESQQWGPTIVGNVRTGTDFNAISPRWAIGNLNGLFDYGTDIYGTAFGNPSGSWVKIDPTNGVRLGYNTTTNVEITAAGQAQFAGDIIGGGVIRSSGATAFGTGTGFHISGSGTPTFRVGNPSGNRLTWDGTAMVLVSENLLIGANGIRVVPATTYNDTRAFYFDTANGDLGIYGADAGGVGIGRSLRSVAEWTGTGDFSNGMLNYMAALHTPSSGGTTRRSEISLIANSTTSQVLINAVSIVTDAAITPLSAGVISFTSGIEFTQDTGVNSAGIGQTTGGGLTLKGISGSTYDMLFRNSAGSDTFAILAGTTDVAFAGIFGDGTGKVVCVLANGGLGTCTNAPNGSGVCTCA